MSNYYLTKFKALDKNVKSSPHIQDIQPWAFVLHCWETRLISAFFFCDFKDKLVGIKKLVDNFHLFLYPPNDIQTPVLAQLPTPHWDENSNKENYTLREIITQQQLLGGLCIVISERDREEREIID